MSNLKGNQNIIQWVEHISCRCADLDGIQCISIPVAIGTFFLLPDTPYTTRVWYLSPRDREIALERVERAGKAPPVKITRKTFKEVLSGWKWYMFVLGYVVSFHIRYVDHFFDN